MRNMKIKGWSAKVTGPSFKDAKFYVEWLLLIALVQECFLRAFEMDARFRRRIERLTCSAEVDFRITGAAIANRLLRGGKTTVDLRDEEAEEFSMLVSMGFFEWCGRALRASLPRCLDAGCVREAMIRLADTEDARNYIHPKRLLNEWVV